MGRCLSHIIFFLVLLIAHFLICSNFSGSHPMCPLNATCLPHLCHAPRQPLLHPLRPAHHLRPRRPICRHRLRLRRYRQTRARLPDHRRGRAVALPTVKHEFPIPLLAGVPARGQMCGPVLRAGLGRDVVLQLVRGVQPEIPLRAFTAVRAPIS
jgi:hypothetical protein